MCLQAIFKKGEPASLRFRLTTGEATLEVRASGGAGAVEVLSKARHVVVPEYFGDDVVLGTEALSGSYLPAESFCLHLNDGGEAILMAVWESSEQDVRVAPAGTGKEGPLSSSRIGCLEEKSICVSFLESAGIWHAASPVQGSSGMGSSAGDVVAHSSWKPPFPAKWRCSLVRSGAVADSWDLEARRRDLPTLASASTLTDFAAPAR